MQFYSTNKKSPLVSLHEAALTGLAPDGGLYMPTEIPQFSENFIGHLGQLSFRDIAFEVASRFVLPDVKRSTLEQIVDEAINFGAPLVKVENDVYSLELFHGPTLAFKDFGARFMSRLTAYYAQSLDRELTVLVATSGDTGSAVANGFHDVPGINVVLLYPSGKVSRIQEQQLTTLEGNVYALEVSGAFDDCQKLVKQAFADNDLTDVMQLTSANSINIARLIPQSFYCFYGFAQLKSKADPVVISVPSGNFGNLTAGLIAGRMGLPVCNFVTSTNVNDVVPKYLETGLFEPKPTIETISKAMDVGNPSNFARILDLYDGRHDRMREDLFGLSFSDDQTLETIQEVYRTTGYILDPHGALGYLGLKAFLANQSKKQQGIFLSTAHPAKFWDVVQPIVGDALTMPDILQQALNKQKRAIPMANDFDSLREFLLGLAG
jgi:threonine synthase